MRVVLTEHAKARMVERDLSAAMILVIIDTGIQKDAGGTHYWLYKHFPGRQDNSIFQSRYEPEGPCSCELLPGVLILLKPEV